MTHAYFQWCKEFLNKKKRGAKDQTRTEAYLSSFCVKDMHFSRAKMTRLKGK